VLRALSPARTIGGGVVLDHRPRRHKGRKSDVWKALEILDRGQTAERLEVFLHKRGSAGLGPQEAQAALGVSLEEARNLLQGVVRRGSAFVWDRRTQGHIHAEVVSNLEGQALDILSRFHSENPLKKGLGVEELRTKFPEHIDPRLVEFVLTRLSESGQAAVDGDLVRRGDFVLQLSVGDEEVRNRVQELVRGRRYEGPTQEELAAALGQGPKALAPVLGYLVGQGLLVRTKEGFYFDAGLLDEFVRGVIALFRERTEIGVAEVKNLTATTRKYTIPLLEYLDGKKVTVRRGDARVAGQKSRG
jgi:selenocysteine-specific elongation factor